jgi:ABC-type transport system involved in multi-copper enzyme maturation permease subunit
MWFTTDILLASCVLVTAQFVAAVPWLWVFLSDPGSTTRSPLHPGALALAAGGTILGGTLALALFMGTIQDQVRMQVGGGVYAAFLLLQLSIDVLIFILAALLLIWPKGGAVALAAFREGWRQPMFWLILILAVVFLLVSPVVPYFTFGEDIKMYKEIGYEAIMIAAAVFAVLAASISISDEIEGRTAVTLMSKPISRRQFLLGKYSGILAAAALLTAVLAWVFNAGIFFKYVYDQEPFPQPTNLDPLMQSWSASMGEVPAAFVGGMWWWGDHVFGVAPGVVLGFCQVIELLAIAVALATRLPMIVNVVVCVVVYFLGHLTPVLEQVAQGRFALVRFVAQLFDTLLPSLQTFELGPAIALDTPPPMAPFLVYVGVVVIYACVYAAIALLGGLILFEDRDLA